MIDWIFVLNISIQHPIDVIKGNYSSLYFLTYKLSLNFHKRGVYCYTNINSLAINTEICILLKKVEFEMNFQNYRYTDYLCLIAIDNTSKLLIASEKAIMLTNDCTE
ncbi:hypothetical protein AVL50_07965 [Flammeovirga sp. SJP92]|nr:hypothetical protein AVL50_07965 [Flammeovirga sp. SJP92]